MADELFLIDGNSLAYRAFFALPESIATSTGRAHQRHLRLRLDAGEDPHRLRPQVHRRRVGRRLERAARRSTPSTRPSAPAARTCSRSSGRTSSRWSTRSGTATSRSTATRPTTSSPRLAEVAKTQDPPIEVMVVTGDRDAYQLVDEQVRIMTTSRGITDTKVYDRQGVIDRYGIPPELVPGLHRAQGRHLGQHPRRPRHRRQDRRRPAPALRLAGERARQHRRDQRRQAQGEPHQPRRRRPRLQAPGHRQARHPARRARRRRVRLPAAGPLPAARGLPRVRAARAAAPARGGARLGRRRRAGPDGRAHDRRHSCARARSGTSSACRRPRSRSPCARRSCPRAPCSPRTRTSGASASTSTRPRR